MGIVGRRQYEELFKMYKNGEIAFGITVKQNCRAYMIYGQTNMQDATLQSLFDRVLVTSRRVAKEQGYKLSGADMLKLSVDRLQATCTDDIIKHMKIIVCKIINGATGNSIDMNLWDKNNIKNVHVYKVGSLRKGSDLKIGE